MIALPTYQAIKALALKRGIEAGLLTDKPASGLPFEAYLHDPSKAGN